MNYSQVYLCDVANGVGCRTSLFVSGCTHHCKGCFNEATWDFGHGRPFSKEIQDTLIAESDHPYVDGFTILGGEPMEVENQKALLPFLERIKHELPGKSVWIYSGYTWEELVDKDNRRCHFKDTEKLLSLTDILVDGEFDESLKDLSLRFRGSSNQHILDVPASLKEGRAVISRYQNRQL